MRRVVALLLAMVMLLTALSVTVYGAQPTVTVKAEQSADGKTVTATVQVSETVDLAGLQLTLAYDTSMLEISGDPVIGGAAASMSHLCNPKNPGEVILVAYSVKDVANKGGSLLTVTFVVKDKASGQTALNLKDVLLVDGKIEEISCTVTSGKVQLKAPDDPETAEPPEIVGSGDLEELAGEEGKASFSDCAGHWAEDYIEEAVEKGLVEGVGGGRYRPNDTMTRSQFVTILWRQSGRPAPAKKASFTDLDPKQTWYHDAVAWAEENEVVNGIGGGKFGPEDPVTREQMMVILFRYSGQSAGLESMLYEGAFRDEDKISPWAKDAVHWAVYHDVYCGVNAVEFGDTLNPLHNATRAQIAVVMTKYDRAFGQ